MNNLDFNAWDKGRQSSFLKINLKSNIKDDWLKYEEVLKTKYKDSIIKPINKYMCKLAIPPRLISIIDNTVTLCQDNFSEIYLLNKEDYLVAIEKIHMRQFYLSDQKNIEKTDCFEDIFRWAMTWFIDTDGLEITILPLEESPFYFYDTSYFSKKEQADIIEPKMIRFQFKNVGSHMKDTDYGRIKRKQPAFLIRFEADDYVIRKVKEFYGHH